MAHPIQLHWAVGVHISSALIDAHSQPISFMCIGGANLVGSDLYNNLIRYFVHHLETLREVSDFPIFAF